jgi:hypothetical protein
MSPIDMLDAAPDLLGHIPEPIADYLEWVLMQDGPARDELVRVLAEVAA